MTRDRQRPQDIPWNDGSASVTDWGVAALTDCQAFKDCHTCADVGALLSQQISRLDMSCCASGMVTGAKAASGDPFHFARWPEAWKSLYLSQGFVQIDPLPRYAIISGLDATWSEVLSRLSKTDPGHKVYAAAAELGFREGIVIPLRNAFGDLGLVTMGGSRETYSADETIYLKTVSSAAFQAAEALSFHDEEPRRLGAFTRREVDCICLLRQGFTDAEIARVLGIADRTVVSHLENARHKVGARSRAHLVSVTAQMTIEFR